MIPSASVSLAGKVVTENFLQECWRFRTWLVSTSQPAFLPACLCYHRKPAHSKGSGSTPLDIQGGGLCYLKNLMACRPGGQVAKLASEPHRWEPRATAQTSLLRAPRWRRSAHCKAPAEAALPAFTVF